MNSSLKLLTIRVNKMSIMSSMSTRNSPSAWGANNLRVLSLVLCREMKFQELTSSHFKIEGKGEGEREKNRSLLYYCLAVRSAGLFLYDSEPKCKKKSYNLP